MGQIWSYARFAFPGLENFNTVLKLQLSGNKKKSCPMSVNVMKPKLKSEPLSFKFREHSSTVNYMINIK